MIYFCASHGSNGPISKEIYPYNDHVIEIIYYFITKSINYQANG
jgi:hypothetical protein